MAENAYEQHEEHLVHYDVDRDCRRSADVLAARAEQEGFIVDRSKLGRGLCPGVRGHHASDPRFKLIGDVHVLDVPRCRHAAEQLRRFFLIARRGLSSGRKPWSGFAFVIALPQVELIQVGLDILAGLAEESGFHQSPVRYERHGDITLLILIHPR